MLPFKIYFIILFGLLASCHAQDSKTLTAEVFVVVTVNDLKKSDKWTNYLYTHLQSRSTSGPKIIQKDQLTTLAAGEFALQIEIKPESKNSYKIVRDKNKLLVICRSEAIALWLIYEVIAKIGEDNCGVNVDDLPPSTIDFITSNKDFDFEYREPFFAPNTEIDYARLLGNHSIDNDWGIWGHQLTQIIDNHHSDTQAQIDGQKTKQQFCFSSPTLYTQIKAYIIDQFGQTPTLNFMLAPNDNDLVCNCARCLVAPNTPTNAAAAVLQFNNRLARDFPTAKFFMLAYRTTQNPSPVKLEKNVGIFMSTIDLPKGQRLTENTAKFQNFKHQILEWKKLTKDVYLWDYAANFDDYLTPIPILLGFQEQAKQFKKLGVSGIFLQGSGYDYAPFDDLKTYVVSALMKDVDRDVNELISRYFRRFYPQSHQLLSSYYSQLEYDFQQQQQAYDLYSGFEEVKKSYLKHSDFAVFHEAVQQTIPKAQQPETAKLNKLNTALGFTQLQLAYSLGLEHAGAFSLCDGQLTVNTDIRKKVRLLETAFTAQNIVNYSERNSLTSYLNQWQIWIDQPYNLTAIDPKELLSTNPHLAGLFDGKLGFSKDFLLGWTINNKDLEVYLGPLPLEINTIKLHFLNDPSHNIYPPRQLSVQTTDSTQPFNAQLRTVQDHVIVYEFDIKDRSRYAPLQIKIINQSEPKSQWACDEFQFLKH